MCGIMQDLVALWADEFGPALALLGRIFPAGLMRFLHQRRAPATAALPRPLPQAGMGGRPTLPQRHV
jgi:hypothetical protein